MGIKSFLAGAEAKGRSLIPLERRLKTADTRFAQSTARLERIKAAIAVQNRIVGDASNALELSVANEAAAENRLANANTGRERASARSDVKSAENLSARNRKAIQQAEGKLKGLNRDLKATRARQSDRAVESANLSDQVKAAKAAAPTRIERVSKRIGQARTRLSGNQPTSSNARSGGRTADSVSSPTTRVTPAASIKITGTGPVVRKLKLKKGETFVVKPGKAIRPATAKFTSRKPKGFT